MKTRRHVTALSGILLVLAASEALASGESSGDRRIKACERNGEFTCLVSPMTPFQKVTSEFGYPEDHSGLHKGADLRARDGTDVYASYPGVVTVADERHDGLCGGMVAISLKGSDDRLVYCHFSKIYVRQGDNVGFRDVIGIAGHTGDARGAHVHIQFRHRGQWVDPMEYMFPREDLPEWVK